FQDLRTLPMPGKSSGTPRDAEIFGTDVKETHGKTRDAHYRDECSSQLGTVSPPLSKVAQSLNHDRINDTGHGSKVVGLVPGLDGYPSEGNDRGDEKESHAAIANHTRQSEQRERQYGTRKKSQKRGQVDEFAVSR